MIYSCPKCGKAIKVTPAQLKKQQGQLVCPQCLLQFTVPVGSDDGGSLLPPALLERAGVTQPQAAPARQPRQQRSTPARQATGATTGGTGAKSGAYCRQCGHKLKASDAYCPACGKAVKAGTTQPRRATAATTSAKVKPRQPQPRPAKQPKPKQQGSNGYWRTAWRTALVMLLFFFFYYVLGNMLD